MPLVLSSPRFAEVAEGTEVASKGEAKVGDVLCVVVETAPFVRCEGGEVADAWGVSLRPFAYFVGPDGKVAETAPTGVVAGSKALADDLVRRVGLWAKDLKKPFPAK